MALTIIEVDQLPPELTTINTSRQDEYSNWGEHTQPPESPRGLRRWVINNNNQPVGSSAVTQVPTVQTQARPQ